MPVPARSVEPIDHPHVRRTPGVCGGKPIIRGTRIKVSHMVTYRNRMGYTPERIQGDFPQLTLAQIYGALAYYFDNRRDIDAQMADEERVEDEMSRGHTSILEGKRDGDSDIHR